jgi:hypothetical protein
MRSSYLIAASLAASVALSPALAVAADTKPIAQAQAAPVPLPGATPLSAAGASNAGCGAVLLMLGKVVDSSPELFAKQANGKAIQTLLSALGLKGKAMMDEAFAEGAANGLSPTQTYDAGVASLTTSIKGDISGASPGEMGKKAGLALMNRCTGM